MIKLILTGVLASFVLMVQPVLADIEKHKHSPQKPFHERMGHHKHPFHQHGEADASHDHDMSAKSDMFLIKKEIDGFTVSFHVMAEKEGMQHGDSHNFMVKVEKDGKVLSHLTANSKVTHPNGKSESKMLMKMGDWYMAGYNLSHEGQHQLMLLFKTSDGKKHFGGVKYPGDQ